MLAVARVGGVVGEPGAALDEDALGHPRVASLRGRLQRPLRGQTQKITRSAASPSSRRPSAARRIACPISSRSHSRSSPPGPAQPPGVENLRLAGRRHGGRLLRFHGPADVGDQPPQRLRVHQVRPAEVVDHLGDRAAGPRVPLIVRQLQVRHHCAIFAPPPRTSPVAYKSSDPGQASASDTPKVVCLDFPPLRYLRASLTSRNGSDQARKCLRAAEVRPERHWFASPAAPAPKASTLAQESG